MPLCLQILHCIFPEEKDILLHNRSTVINFRKFLTLKQHFKIIYHLLYNLSIDLIMSFIAFVFSSTRGCSIRIAFDCFFSLFHLNSS